MPKILKATHSRGGKCQHCHRAMVSGSRVFKIDDGKARRGANPTDGGPGSRVCERCAWRYMGQLALFEIAEADG